MMFPENAARFRRFAESSQGNMLMFVGNTARFRHVVEAFCRFLVKQKIMADVVGAKTTTTTALSNDAGKEAPEPAAN